MGGGSGRARYAAEGVARTAGWFQNGEASALKIAAHEAFHLLQYEVVGQRSMSASTLDEIPPAGPWWLAEGTAEYFAYLAIARDGVLRIADVRAQWLQSAKSTSATLRALATLRGQREHPTDTTSMRSRQISCYAVAIRSSYSPTTKGLLAERHGRMSSPRRSAEATTLSSTSSSRIVPRANSDWPFPPTVL